jgi:hypothetical protein
MRVPVPGSFRRVQMAMPCEAVPCPSVPACKVASVMQIPFRGHICMGFCGSYFRAQPISPCGGKMAAGDRAK